MDRPATDASDLEQLISLLPVAAYVCDAPAGTLRIWNQRAVTLWGRTPRAGDADQRFCGSVRLFGLNGEPLPHDRTPMAEVLATGEPRSGEVFIERPDGTRSRVSASIAPLRDEAGRLTGALNVLQDLTEQMRAGEALRLSEARYKAIVEDQPDLVCRFRPDGSLTFANQAYCDYFGFRQDLASGAPYLPVVHPDDLPQVQAQVATLSPGNPVVFIENRVLRADGAVRWTQWTNRALFGPDRQVLEFQASGRDITERKQAEEDAARLAAIVASADAAIYGMTLDGIITSWNRAAERVFSYAAADALGRPIDFIVPVDRRDEAARILSRLRRGEIVDHLETERVAADGRRVPVSLTVSPIRDANGQVTGISAIARDVTARKQSEERLRLHLRTLEQLYRLVDTISRAPALSDICEAAVDAIVAIADVPRASILMFDEQGVMRFCAARGLSPAYQEAVQGHSPWTPEVVAPAPIVVPDVGADDSLGALREVILAEGIRALAFVPLVYQDRLLGKFMVYHDAPHAFAADELRLARTIAHHIAFGIVRAQHDAAVAEALSRERGARADADAARADAERASRAKDEFLAMLAHELRNPLSVLANASAVLGRTPPSDEVAARAQITIRRQIDHLGRLLDDLLDVARITGGQIQLQRKPVDVRTVVDLAVESHRHRIEQKGQQVRVSIAPEPLMVVGDSVRLQQVLGNLLSNASKYTPVAGAISVTAGTEDQHVVVRVRDDGIGIPAGQLEWVFELFSQAHPTLARTEGGLGIGLTVARRILDLHGGTIRASSAGPNAGTEFVVQLPLAPDAALHPPADAAPFQPRPRRILVIEDHDDGREMLVSALQLFGHDVVEAATGGDGIALAAEHAPDVVLIDIGLPDMQGYEVAQALRGTLDPATRLIALTGYGQPADRRRSEHAGFHEHLVKPIDPRQLVEILDRLS